MSLFSRLHIRYLFSRNKALFVQLEHVLGFQPKQLRFYEIALTHRSSSDEISRNNERLEFLGDAMLGAIVGEFLFRKYPSQDEGFLTEIRSRIVRRESLNAIATRMGIEKIVQYNKYDRGLSRSHIFGNALEALIGAIYLDRGYELTRHFVLNELIKNYIDLDTIEKTDTNYKNQLLTWAQKNMVSITFEELDVQQEGIKRMFTIGIKMDETIIATGTGYNKKDAGQVAAQNAMQHLGISNKRN
ncbi:MAG: ribonuclease III [Bacteroidota bacterium]